MALQLSQLLDLHLSRVIARYHKPEAPVSKFLQLADDIESDLKDMDDEADVLNEKRLANKERARQVFNDHHKTQDRITDGLYRMGAVIHDMSGSNSSREPSDAEKKAIMAAHEAAIAAHAEAEKAKQSSSGDKAEAPKLGEGSGVTPESFRGDIVVDGEVIDTSGDAPKI